MISTALRVAILVALPLPSILAQTQFRAQQVAPNAIVTGIAFVDLDRDGDQDVLSLRSGSLLWLENSGAGEFAEHPLPARLSTAASIAVGDFDGDGDDDGIAVSPNLVDSYLVESTAAGPSVVPLGLPTGTGPQVRLAGADVDRDGDLDVALQPSQGQPVLLRNDGTGRFTVDRTPFSGIFGQLIGGIETGDINGDGAPDFFADGLFGSLLMLNDGAGAFTATLIPSGVQGAVTGATMADFTGDGLDDVFVMRSVTGGGVLLAADGQGGLIAASTVAAQGWFAIASADIDEDGDIDVVGSAGTGGNGFNVLLNDGAGGFTDATASRVDTVGFVTAEIAVGDADGDGDIDALVAGFPLPLAQPQLLVRNFHRQVEVVAQGQIGGAARIRCSWQPGYGRALAVGLLAFGPAAASAATTPFGTVHLDPAAAISLPFVSLPPPTGEGVVVLAIPNDPGLVGAEVLVQALVFDLFAPAPRLTGFARVRVLP